MPTDINDQQLWVRDGIANADSANETVAQLPYPGQVGKAFTVNSVRRQRVKLDSGATVATPTGVVAAGQAAFYKDELAGLVTNDVRFAQNGPAGAKLAGIFTFAVTAGNVCFISKRRRAYPVTTTGGSWAAGDVAMFDHNQLASATPANQFERIAAGTAPTYRFLVAGIVTGVTVASKTPVDLDIPDGY